MDLWIVAGFTRKRINKVLKTVVGTGRGLEGSSKVQLTGQDGNYNLELK
jgi:hypothetical protein